MIPDIEQQQAIARQKINEFLGDCQAANNDEKEMLLLGLIAMSSTYMFKLVGLEQTTVNIANVLQHYATRLAIQQAKEDGQHTTH